MATLTLTLSDEAKAFLDAQAAREGHPSPDAYLLALIRDARVREARREIDAKLIEALESGPAEPMTTEDWQALRREALDGLKDEVIRP